MTNDATVMVDGVYHRGSIVLLAVAVAVAAAVAAAAAAAAESRNQRPGILQFFNLPRSLHPDPFS